MRRDEWARLAAPFPPQALDWWVAQLDSEGRAGRLEPVLAERAAIERLDEVLGIEGWSKRLIPLGGDAVVCELELLGVRKSEVARSFDGLLDMQRVCAWAFGRAAALFGLVPPPAQAAWVDIDAETGEPLYLPDGEAEILDPGGLSVGSDPLPGGLVAPGAPAASEESPAAFDGARSQGQEAIHRLVDRLRAEGLGREAARLVVAHGGNGGSSEDARELYRKLRALLLEKGAVS